MYDPVCMILYVCLYVCMYACMTLYVCMYVWMYVCLYVCTYVCMHVCMYDPVRMYVCMYVCMSTVLHSTDSFTNLFLMCTGLPVCIWNAFHSPFPTLSFTTSSNFSLFLSVISYPFSKVCIISILYLREIGNMWGYPVLLFFVLTLLRFQSIH